MDPVGHSPRRRIPEDPQERAAWLQQWSAEQGERDPLRARLRLRVATVVERQVERLDPVLDRGLHTSRDEFFPSPEGAGLMYVAGPTPWHILPRPLRKVGASDRDVFADSAAAGAGSSIRPRGGR